jgi:hypothetical protein
MGNYGIKISRPGFDVRTALPHQLSFSSAYKTLKIASQGGGTLTQTSNLVTIPHNLGYVPFFLVHTQIDAPNSVVGNNQDFFISPFRLSAAIDIWEPEATHDIIAYADTTNLYIKANENAGKSLYPAHVPGLTNADENLAYEYSNFGGSYLTGSWFAGDDSAGLGNLKGALRFVDLDLDNAETIYSASLNLYAGTRVGSSQINLDVWGIDEDNTGAFNSGTAATARTKTSAKTDHNFTISAGQYAGADVKAQVEEIIARGGWANGNEMGFIVENDASPANNYLGENSSSGQSFLEIIRSVNIAEYKYTIFLNQLE